MHTLFGGLFAATFTSKSTAIRAEAREITGSGRSDQLSVCVHGE